MNGCVLTLERALLVLVDADRDLLEASMTLTRQLKTEQLREGIKPAVERRILEALTGPEVRVSLAWCCVAFVPLPQAPRASHGQAREDTVESFRRLLHSHDLDDREIVVEVPSKPGANVNYSLVSSCAQSALLAFSTAGGGGPLGPDFEMSMAGATIDLGDLVARLGGGGGAPGGGRKTRVERKKVKVKDVRMVGLSNAWDSSP